MAHVSPAVSASDALQYMCLSHLLKGQAERTPDAPALVAPGRTPLTYGRLYRHINDIVHKLHALGLRRHDRVALVLPNGPEMAVAFLAVAAGMACAPLNPAYNADEYAFYLTDLHVKALVVQADMDSPARAVAQAHRIAIIELSPVLEVEAGLFTLTSEARPCTSPHGVAQPDDVALVLHTSGSTSRPKVVPLTHANILASAHSTRVAVQLTASDRCLNILPLFHCFGLITTLLSSLLAGASTICTPGFAAPTFFVWMAEFCPTWYTAVPTIHQAILSYAVLHGAMRACSPLRCILSGASSLSPRVLMELEKVFHAPVIEGYGMTETSGYITCNLLPPYTRKPNSVGVAVGTEVAIMDETGRLLSAGNTGEVVVRGANVMHGYANHPGANSLACTHGWLRTGDQGYVDPDGYLFLTGRLKEIINRGGEKIAPREVDDVLMVHPAVAQAVTFAVPHIHLGEDIAAAVVLHQDAWASASDIRQFAATRLADFKVPSQVYIVEQIPQGPTGKMQRLGLAAQLGLTASAPNLPHGDSAHDMPVSAANDGASREAVEQAIAEVWQEVLHRESIDIDGNFFDLGGYSLLMVQVQSKLQEILHRAIPIAEMFQYPTVRSLARYVLSQGKSAVTTFQKIQERVQLHKERRKQRPFAQKARGKSKGSSHGQL